MSHPARLNRNLPESKRAFLLARLLELPYWLMPFSREYGLIAFALLSGAFRVFGAAPQPALVPARQLATVAAARK